LCNAANGEFVPIADSCTAARASGHQVLAPPVCFKI
jgi:hypothetical protein